MTRRKSWQKISVSAPCRQGQSAAVQRIPAELLERKEEQRVLGLLADYEWLLKQWKEEYAPATPDTENWDERFCQAIRHQMPVGYAIECLISSDPDERKEMMETIRDMDAAAKIEDILKNGIHKEQTWRVRDPVPQNQQERGEHAQAQRRACEETEQNAREENHAA